MVNKKNYDVLIIGGGLSASVFASNYLKFNLSSNTKEAKELLNKKIGEKSSINLSGGEIQRLSFIRALLRRPTILYIDEATSALDDLNSEIIMNSLLDYAESVIVISHSKLNEKFYNQTLSFEKI